MSDNDTKPEPDWRPPIDSVWLWDGRRVRISRHIQLRTGRWWVDGYEIDGDTLFRWHRETWERGEPRAAER